MGVTQGSVQENISKAAAPDVNWLVGYISEDDPVGIHSPVSSLLPDHGLAVWRKAQQPQHAVWYTLQNIAPALMDKGYCQFAHDCGAQVF